MIRLPRFGVLMAVVVVSMMGIPYLRNSSAQEQKRPSLPLPEMQRLAKAYVGTWAYTETYPKSAMMPDGGVNTGVYTSELGPGGNSIFNRFHSKGPVGDFEGAIVMTWDAKEKAYKAFVFGGDFPGVIVQSGQFEGDSLVYRSELTMGARKIAMRNVTNFSDGKIISEQYSSVNGAPEALLVRVEAVKK